MGWGGVSGIRDTSKVGTVPVETQWGRIGREISRGHVAASLRSAERANDHFGAATCGTLGPS